MNTQRTAAVVNLLPTIKPKSDQLNADDLIGGPMTITVTKVSLCGEADQPIAVHFEGDGGKPYKPCKSMRRVMVNVWGSDGNEFVGRSMTLYRDEKVVFGGAPVGGIRISHMSDIDREMTMALTATRAQRKPYTVKPLPGGVRREPTRRAAASDDSDFPGDRPTQQRQAPTPSDGPPLTLEQRAGMFQKRMMEAASDTKVNAVWNANGPLRDALESSDPERLVALQAVRDARIEELQASAGDAC